MANPIWKDYFVTLGTADAIIYRIKLDSTSAVIYTGKAYKRPGDTATIIRINDVCADFLSNALPEMSQAEFTDLSFPLTFKIETYNGSTWTNVHSVTFINDWSYDYGYDVETDGMAFPITSNIDERQWVVYTAYNAESITATIRYADNSQSVVIIPVAISADFNDDFNSDFARSARSAGSGTAVFKLSDWQNAVSITIGNKTYRNIGGCKEWVLYYVNAYGGWDSLLIEGNTQEADSLERHTRMMEYNNNNIQNRGKANFVNEITKTYTLHTGWMTDDQASRMHHLINSVEVYLFHIPTGNMMPVNITDPNCEYKTYKGNGNSLVNYTIQAEVAQNRIRR